MGTEVRAARNLFICTLLSSNFLNNLRNWRKDKVLSDKHCIEHQDKISTRMYRSEDLPECCAKTASPSSYCTGYCGMTQKCCFHKILKSLIFSTCRPLFHFLLFEQFTCMFSSLFFQAASKQSLRAALPSKCFW